MAAVARKEIVFETLMNSFPQGTPPLFSTIGKTVWDGEDTIRSDLVMIDGFTATVVLRRWWGGWSSEFENMIGGPLWFDGGRWRRTEFQQVEMAI